MLDYKKVLKNTINLIKENKLVAILALIISLSGIIYFSNILSNYNYFINHRYFISLATNIKELATVFQSIIYNSVIANIGESITVLFNLNNTYLSTSLINKTLVFGIITFIIVLIMFFITNISTIFVIYSSKKQKITDLIKENKNIFKNVILLDLLRILSIIIIFGIIIFTSLIFSLNSYLYIIISFFISGLLFFIIFFILQYSLRYIIFFKNNLVDSIKNSINLFFTNIKESILNILLLFIHLILLFIALIIISLPVLLFDFYFINSGYLIFNSVNTIFINIIIVLFATLSNIYIIKYINELFGNLILKNKK